VITLDERLFAELVIGWKQYAIVGQDVKDAVENSDYGTEHLVCENDKNAVGWAGPALGQVADVTTDKSGQQLYRLWRRSDYDRVGNLARERGEARDRANAEAEAKKTQLEEEYAKRLASKREEMIQHGAPAALVDKIFADMSESDINKMLGY